LGKVVLGMVGEEKWEKFEERRKYNSKKV